MTVSLNMWLTYYKKCIAIYFTCFLNKSEFISSFGIMVRNFLSFYNYLTLRFAVECIFTVPSNPPDASKPNATGDTATALN